MRKGFSTALQKVLGLKINTYNLCISGCPLKLHYRNMLDENMTYWLEMNGESVGFQNSLKEALFNRSRDVTSVQQVRPLANNYDLFRPYGEEVKTVFNRITKSYRTFNRARKYACGWMYDRDTGALQFDAAPGTKFEDLPGGLACPQCGTPRIAFFEQDMK